MEDETGRPSPRGLKLTVAFSDCDAHDEVRRKFIFSEPVRLASPVRLGVEGRRSADPAGRPEPRRGSPMPAIETRLSRRALVASGIAGGILATLPAQSQTGSPTMETTIRVDSAVTSLHA
jgi:hypothetical protein